MKQRALVLGGGGRAGIAWEVGLVSGLAEGGVDLARANVILGTSAGAFVGAQVASGISPQALAQYHLAAARGSAPSQANEPPGNTDHLAEYMARRPTDSAPSPSTMAELGRIALAAQTMPEEQYVAHFNGMFGSTGAWPEKFACCTVRAHDGAFKVWSKSDEVAIERAVAASCSLPGLHPPVTLGDTQWIDGGLRSWTNAEFVVGYGRVLIIAVVTPGTAAMLTSMLTRERASIEAAHGTSSLVTPDDHCVELFGDNLMVARRVAEIVEAGIVQGRAEASRIRAFWD